MIALYIIAGILLILLVVLTLEFSLLVPPQRGLPILMYHKVSDGFADGLTIPAGMLERQFCHLRAKGYQSLTFAELERYVKEKSPLPRKPVIITFDDADQSFHDRALPLLKDYRLNATVFVPLAYMGKTNLWDKGNDRVMAPETIHELATREKIEIGLHSFLHRSYDELAREDMEEDLDNCFSTLTFYNIPFVKVLAYPYGGFPKKEKDRKEEMKNLFREKGLSFALRIGNRINRWPPADPYEMKRIDIRGTDNFFTFKTKLKKGRKKLFS